MAEFGSIEAIDAAGDVRTARGLQSAGRKLLGNMLRWRLKTTPDHLGTADGLFSLHAGLRASRAGHRAL